MYDVTKGHGYRKMESQMATSVIMEAEVSQVECAID